MPSEFVHPRITTVCIPAKITISHQNNSQHCQRRSFSTPHRNPCVVNSKMFHRIIPLSSSQSQQASTHCYPSTEMSTCSIAHTATTKPYTTKTARKRKWSIERWYKSVQGGPINPSEWLDRVNLSQPDGPEKPSSNANSLETAIGEELNRITNHTHSIKRKMMFGETGVPHTIKQPLYCGHNYESCQTTEEAKFSLPFNDARQTEQIATASYETGILEIDHDQQHFEENRRRALISNNFGPCLHDDSLFYANWPGSATGDQSIISLSIDHRQTATKSSHSSFSNQPGHFSFHQHHQSEHKTPKSLFFGEGNHLTSQSSLFIAHNQQHCHSSFMGHGYHQQDMTSPSNIISSIPHSSASSPSTSDDTDSPTFTNRCYRAQYYMSPTLQEAIKRTDNRRSQPSYVPITPSVSTVSSLSSFQMGTKVTPATVMLIEQEHLPQVTESIMQATRMEYDRKQARKRAKRETLDDEDHGSKRAAHSIQLSPVLPLPPSVMVNVCMDYRGSMAGVVQNVPMVSSPPMATSTSVPASQGKPRIRRLEISNKDKIQHINDQGSDHLHTTLAEDTSNLEISYPERKPGDLYSPVAVRGKGYIKEGKCPLCPGDLWLKIKQSAYWYHMNFVHGISAVSGTYHPMPTQYRITNEKGNHTIAKVDLSSQLGSQDHGCVNSMMIEAHCATCNQWVVLAVLGHDQSIPAPRDVSHLSWFKHAQKCTSTNMSGTDSTLTKSIELQNTKEIVSHEEGQGVVMALLGSGHTNTIAQSGRNSPAVQAAAKKNIRKALAMSSKTRIKDTTIDSHASLTTSVSNLPLISNRQKSPLTTFVEHEEGK